MPDPDRLPAAKRARSRTAGWQAERRAETRQRLLDAAADTFGQMGYVGTRVEDILAAAQIGRTSFYKQFRDRLDVASVLFTQFMPHLEGVYIEIADCREIDHLAVERWIERLIDAYAQHRGVMRLFAEVAAIEPAFSSTIAQVQTGIMRALGVRFDGFARAVAADGGEPHARAVLVIETLDHISAMISLRQVPIDRPTAVRFAAGVFLDFIHSGPGDR
ncbi:TetR/AcrR family transcriptional regulator [Sphingobium sp. WCS2017Hpa-17]|uniref:TetR/AcrR family transcriptional regulator n=1 Tax=Sphingobium sp. WCS2017Hpa-17 TaxID=3073638 RepID=UPI00288B04D7|nr:TetR/AcrR family transcriptional regulator [Sphingobium sp. WCS2017Hpa-17]